MKLFLVYRGRKACFSLHYMRCNIYSGLVATGHGSNGSSGSTSLDGSGVLSAVGRVVVTCSCRWAAWSGGFPRCVSSCQPASGSITHTHARTHAHTHTHTHTHTHSPYKNKKMQEIPTTIISSGGSTLGEGAQAPKSWLGLLNLAGLPICGQVPKI